jgi:phosphatidate cytidylyltransferase
MARRALSALIFVPPLLIVVAAGEPWFGGLIAIFAVVAAWEASGLLAEAGYRAPLWLLAPGALAVAADVAAPSWLAGYGDLLIAAVLVVTGVASLFEKDTRAGFAAWMATAFGAVYVGMLGALVRIGLAAPALAVGSPAASSPIALDGGRGWILLAILLVWAYDTGAYLVGIALGKRKFLAHISPSKSYWGLFGGLVASTAVGAAGFWVLGQPVVLGLVLGPIVGLAAQAGDLAESMLKRAAGAKDSSGLIPGHGGILDRVDSFIFAAPVVTLYVAAFVR